MPELCKVLYDKRCVVPKGGGSNARAYALQVGAQNAGKSSLINAMKRAVGHGNPKQELTTAALPGTTLGEPATPSPRLSRNRLPCVLSIILSRSCAQMCAGVGV